MLYIFNDVGRYYLPAIALSAPIAELKCNKYDFLMVILQDGNLIIWKLDYLRTNRHSQILKSSIAHLLSSSIKFHSSQINDDGIPILTFSNHFSYSYLPLMNVWARIIDNNFGGSDFTTQLSKPSPMFKNGILSALLKPATLSCTELLHTTERQRLLQSLSFLENRMCSALSVHSIDEYKI